MSDKYVSVPRELLDRVLFSIMEQGFEADGQYELVLIQKAPAAHPLIKTLHDKGELIALKATVAQQARMIEALQAEADRALAEEPVMRLECEKLWGGHGEYAVDFVKPGWLDECRKKGGTFLLYCRLQRPE